MYIDYFYYQLFNRSRSDTNQNYLIILLSDLRKIKIWHQLSDYFCYQDPTLIAIIWLFVLSALKNTMTWHKLRLFDYSYHQLYDRSRPDTNYNYFIIFIISCTLDQDLIRIAIFWLFYYQLLTSRSDMSCSCLIILLSVV